MSKRFFVDDAVTVEGKYRVLQEDLETMERFGVKDFDTREEAQNTADDMQKAVDKILSEKATERLPSLPLSDQGHKNKFKDTLQDLKNDTSQE